MAQKNRKIHSKRGTRSCGYGNAQKHRGSGSRGGRGKAGSGKHKQIKMNIAGVTFGKVGFKRHPSLVSDLNTINLSDIEERIGVWSEEGKAKKTAGGYSINLSELGYDKVLGKGALAHKIEIKAKSFSESAKKKIEEAGGKVITDGIDTV
jgi:large subunit ribosomal protein L15